MDKSSLVKNWATAPHLVVPFWQIMPQMKAQHFFSALWPLPPARYHRSLLPYAILANSNDFLSRKRQKTSFLAHFGPFLPKFGPQHFFFENRASSLFSTPWTLTSCKKAKKTYGWKYENFCCRQTDTQTDGRSWFYRTALRGSKKQRWAPNFLIDYWLSGWWVR